MTAMITSSTSVSDNFGRQRQRDRPVGNPFSVRELAAPVAVGLSVVRVKVQRDEVDSRPDVLRMESLLQGVPIHSKVVVSIRSV